MNSRRQVHNGFDTKFRIQGAMKVDLSDPMELARNGQELLREATRLTNSVAAGDLDNAEQEMLYNSRITALSALATANFTAASFYWEDR